MPYALDPFFKKHPPSFTRLFRPAQDATIGVPPLQSRGNRPLQMNFEDHLKALVFFHLEEHTSAQHLLQVLQEDDFARDAIAPTGGIKKSSFSEATNSRGLEQFAYVFERLQRQATNLLPMQYPQLGNLIGIDGSLIDCVLSMLWADYRKGAKKAKVHVGFDLNRGIPRKIFLSDGDGAEYLFVSQILSPGQTGVTDRGYQYHEYFDLWQEQKKFFVCRIKANTRKICIRVKGEVKTFEGLLFLERGTGESLGKLFGLRSFYLILDHHLKEGEVVKLFFTGLLEPEIQRFNESSKTKGFQSAGNVMFYVHGCTSISFHNIFRPDTNSGCPLREHREASLVQNSWAACSRAFPAIISVVCGTNGQHPAELYSKTSHRFLIL